MEWLQLHKRADKSGDLPKHELLADPAFKARCDGGDEEACAKLEAAPDSWPLAGVELLDKAPKDARLSTGYVAQGQGEGWIELTNLRLAVDDAGMWAHADEVILHLAGEDVVYKVVENPGYHEDPEAAGEWPEYPANALQRPHRVSHEYLLRHKSGGRG